MAWGCLLPAPQDVRGGTVREQRAQGAGGSQVQRLQGLAHREAGPQEGRG